MLSFQRVLGVDAGGSKVVALVADGAGQALGRGLAEGANWLTAASAASDALRLAIQRVLGEAGVEASLIEAACIGAAGADRPVIAGLIEALVRECLPAAQVRVVPDAVLGLAAAGLEAGVVVVAGTGSIAYGRNSAGREARAGGWGYLLGDEGSAFDVGRQAVVAALSARDGRGTGTILVPFLIRHCGLKELEDVVEWVYSASQARLALASLAPLVGQAAASGDQVALGILARAGIELGLAVGAVIRRLGLGSEQVPLVPVGGLFAAGESLLSPLLRVAAKEAQVVVHWPEDEPALGAARLALRLRR